ncbi:unnamed protein product [Chondrus crispus]|uniref:Uncharacterized protein n=1 Tax=Chondrus crispus TaxID=2769 RepID=R7Q3J3_CHOCR|nr:unnamed protein product [Chondrus crispus]CDF32453.1 unnamed protein product [Chondrus crispus]|eukprot:XP_005712118.1 unnamed protein product [Chondrus crispus]
MPTFLASNPHGRFMPSRAGIFRLRASVHRLRKIPEDSIRCRKPDNIIVCEGVISWSCQGAHE